MPINESDPLGIGNSNTATLEPPRRRAPVVAARSIPADPLGIQKTPDDPLGIAPAPAPTEQPAPPSKFDNYTPPTSAPDPMKEQPIPHAPEPKGPGIVGAAMQGGYKALEDISAFVGGKGMKPLDESQRAAIESQAQNLEKLGQHDRAAQVRSELTPEAAPQTIGEHLAYGGANAVPMIVSGPAAPVTGFAQYAGGARTEVEARRAAGQEITPGQEEAYSLGTGTGGAAMAYAGGKLTEGIANVVPNIAGRIAANIPAGAAAGVAGQAIGNVTAKATGVDPNREITAGFSEAAKQGAILNTGFAIAHEAVGPPHDPLLLETPEAKAAPVESSAVAPSEAPPSQPEAKPPTLPEPLDRVPAQFDPLQLRDALPTTASRPTVEPEAQNQQATPPETVDSSAGETANRTGEPATVDEAKASVSSEQSTAPAPVESNVNDPLELTRTPAKLRVKQVQPAAEEPPAPDVESTSSEPTTSARKAQMAEDRKALGLDELPDPERKSWETNLDNARKQGIPERAMRVAADVNEIPRALSDDETAGLVLHASDLKRDHASLMQEVGKSNDPAEIATKSAEITRIEQDFDQLSQALRSSGTEKGRALAAQKLTINQNYDLVSVKNRAKVAKGKDLSPAESTRLQTLTTKLDEMNTRVAEFEKQFAEQKNAHESQMRELESKLSHAKMRGESKATRGTPKERVSTFERMESFARERMASRRKSEADRLSQLSPEQRRQRGSAGSLSPDDLLDYAMIAAAKIGKGAQAAATWTKDFVEEFGEGVRAHLSVIGDKAKELIAMSPEQRAALVEQTQAKATAIESVKAKFSEGGEVAGQAVQKLAKAFVREGITEREALIDAVHGELKKINPNITRDQTMDAISGYGDYKQLSKDEIDVKLRDLKGQMQQLGKLRDLEQRLAPKKTGVERRTPSLEERELLKQANDLRKKLGIETIDPATQLKSTLDAIKTRLKNEIEELDSHIASKEKIVRDKSSVQYDEEANTLKTRRDELRGQYDEIFGEPKKTVEQAKQEQLAKQIAEIDKKIKDNDLSVKAGRPTVDTKEVAALRAQKDALNKQLAEMRKAAAPETERKPAEKIKEDRLTKQIDDIEKKLAANDLSKRTGTPTVDTATVASLRARRDGLNKQLSELRKAAEPPKPEKTEDQINEQRVRIASKVLDRSIAKLETDLKAGKIYPERPESKTPVTPELQAKRDQLATLRAQRDQLQAQDTPRIIADRQKQIQASIAEMNQRIAKGDFSRPAKKVPPTNAELDRLTYQKNRLQQQIRREIENLKPKSLFLRGLEHMNAARAIMTTGEFSFVLRQGGTTALSHPIQTTRAAASAFRAFASDLYTHRMEQEIANHPAAPLAHRAGLAFISPDAVLSGGEKAYAASWAEKIPGLHRFSRAGEVFLNKVRVDTFDTLAKSLARSGEPTLDEAKAIARYVNESTGHGSLPGFERSAAALNSIFFSPRYVLSRFQYLTGHSMWGGTGRTRGLIAKEYAKTLVGLGVVYALGAAAGATIEKDPRSTDFGKLKFGNTRVDPLMGLAQVITLISRETSGTTIDSNRKVVPLTGKHMPYKGDSPLSIALKFGRSKLAPVPGAIVNAREGKDAVGQPTSLGNEGAKLVVPLTYADIYKAIEDQGVERGTAMSLATFFGMGLQTYQKRKPKR